VAVTMYILMILLGVYGVLRPFCMWAPIAVATAGAGVVEALLLKGQMIPGIVMGLFLLWIADFVLLVQMKRQELWRLELAEKRVEP